MALKHFEEQGVECAVLEAGLGGRIDATSAIEHSVVSVVTSVGLDHMHILGNTVEDIAAEKAGVFRTGSHAVIGPSMSSNVLSVLRDAAQAQVISASDCVLILARRASGLVSRMHTMVPTLKFKTVPLLQLPSRSSRRYSW